MYKAFRYRLYPTKIQVEVFNYTIDLCRHLYNGAIQERRDAWKQSRISISFSQQSAQLPAIKGDCTEYKSVFSQVLQDVLHRVDKTFKAFYHRVKLGKIGYPRFKGYDRFNSFTYPQSGFEIQGNKLMVSKIGAVKIKLHRPIEGQVKTLAILREAGRWYAIFSCIVVNKPLPVSDKAIGIDVGLEYFLATSDGEFVANPRFLRRAEDSLAIAQRRLASKKKGSSRRHKAKSIIAHHHAKVANARRDFHHKTARQLINTHGFIALENLNIKGMIHNHHLAKSISDAGWGQFVSILQVKAEEAGREVILVNSRNTSQMCSNCGQIVSKDLSQRWHFCSCGLSVHRDINASRNILALGLSVQGLSLRSPAFKDGE